MSRRQTFNLYDGIWNPKSNADLSLFWWSFQNSVVGRKFIPSLLKLLQHFRLYSFFNLKISWGHAVLTNNFSARILYFALILCTRNQLPSQQKIIRVVYQVKTCDFYILPRMSAKWARTQVTANQGIQAYCEDKNRNGLRQYQGTAQSWLGVPGYRWLESYQGVAEPTSPAIPQTQTQGSAEITWPTRSLSGVVITEFWRQLSFFNIAWSKHHFHLTCKRVKGHNAAR